MAYFAEQVWSPTSESILAWDEAFHELMLGDSLRMTAYRKAIFETVKPGDQVVDLGVGTGILSQWALEAGAGRVFGIEMNQQILSRALDQLSKAGYRDRFVPVNEMSVDVELEAPVDVLISEIIGNMADNENFQPILHDAVRRFLKPGGRQIPQAVASYLAPVSAPHAHQSVCDQRIFSLTPRYDLRTSVRTRKSTSPFDLYYDCILPEGLYLDRPRVVCRYGEQWDQAPTYDKQLRYTVSRHATLTGFKVYFIADLTPETRLDISGGEIAARETSDSWKHAYLPIGQPIAVAPQDVLEMTFSRHCPRSRDSYFQQIYQWRGTVKRDGVEIGRFSQRTE